MGASVDAIETMAIIGRGGQPGSATGLDWLLRLARTQTLESRRMP